VHRVLAGRQLDFRVLMSSNAALLGGPGLALYGPVNAYQQAFATATAHLPGGGWTAIGWDGWRLDEDPPGSADSSLSSIALPGDQVFGVLGAAVRSGLSSVYVSRADMRERYATWVPGVVDAAPSTIVGEGAPAEEAAFDEPPSGADDPAEVVVGLWRQLLGVDVLTPQDDLFGLGGTSLTVMRLRARLRDRLGHDVPLAQLMEHRTVGAMVALVTGVAQRDDADRHVLPAAPPTDDADILAILAELSDDGREESYSCD
jgi:phthiocerol/phenolphthiocerol synthesis type-I polyketide synthase E